MLSYSTSMFIVFRSLYDEWTIELKEMADRIISMRQQLFDALTARGEEWGQVSVIQILVGWFPSIWSLDLGYISSLKNSMYPFCLECWCPWIVICMVYFSPLQSYQCNASVKSWDHSNRIVHFFCLQTIFQ